MLKPGGECYSKSMNSLPAVRHTKQKGFTIVELLIVIVVIGILAAITTVAYNGIQNRARTATIKSDLSQADKQLKVFKAGSSSGKYPATVSTDCTASPDSATNKCLKLSAGNTVAAYSSPSPNDTFSLTIAGTGNTMPYMVTNSSGPALVSADAFDGITIGSQTWATANLNVGTMVTGTTAQTDNSTVEKYCYNDLESNCSTYGALYQWDEAMKYSTTEGAQGICPAGSHIPTDTDWKTLEITLGMTQSQADVPGWRGTDQGTKLKTGGSSGLGVPLAGYRYPAGSYGYLGAGAYVWSSSESGGSAWQRHLNSGSATVHRLTSGKAYGFSVRCLGN